MAGFVECLGCVELLKQQEVKRLEDAAKAHSLQQVYKANPHKTPHLMTEHRHWRLWEQPPLNEHTYPPF